MNMIKDVIDLDIYDEHGRKITTLDCLKEGSLQYKNYGDDSIIVVKDVLFNLDLVRQIGNSIIEKYTSDFDTRIGSKSGNVETIKFNSKKENVKLKLVGSGVIYSTRTGAISHDFDMVMPKVELVIGREYDFSQQPMTSKYYFKILPYNDSGDVFDLVLKERA